MNIKSIRLKMKKLYDHILNNLFKKYSHYLKQKNNVKRIIPSKFTEKKPLSRKIPGNLS